MNAWWSSWNQGSGIRGRFALAMGVFVISSGLAMTLLVEWRLSSGLQTAARDHLQHIAGDVARNLQQDLSTRRQEVNRLAVVLGSANVVHSRAAQQVLDGLKSQQPAYAWIGLTDNKGKVIAASDGMLNGVDVSARPWFSGGQKPDYFGDPHEAKLLAKLLATPDSKEPLRFFDIAAPVRANDGSWDGVLGAHLYTGWIQNVVEDAIASRIEDYPLDVFVADSAGAWLYKPRQSTLGKLDDLHVGEQNAQYLMASQKVTVMSGNDWFDWTVVVRENARDAFAPVYQTRRQMLILTPLVALLLALGTWAVAGRVVLPYQRLADAARQHAQTTGHSLGAGRDEAQLLDQTMNMLALQDPLTGLANRSAVKLKLGQLQQRQSRMPFPEPHAVLLCNLDDFHVINNAKGHEAGNEVLQAVAARLRLVAGADTLVARLGGDEFALLMEKLDLASDVARQRAQDFAHRLLDAFKAPLEVPSGPCQCSMSVGIVLVDSASTAPETALAQAEQAMQEAKHLGKQQATLFDEHLHERLMAQARFEQELHDAVPSQLVVLYQPQMNRDHKMIGAELLVRWKHPVHGFVSPARFIPVAEQTGLIVQIGNWVLAQACQQLKVWENDPQRQHMVLAVNVSAAEFTHPDYLNTVQSTLQETGIRSDRLKLELTESVLATDVDTVVARMKQLKALGVSFSLDDFGTGFSSLSYLNRMPIDQLKIDQSFVREMLQDDSSAAIVRTVVALGNSLGLTVIAEGVETQAQCQRLLELGCFFYQGYLFGKPVPVEQLAV